jgi:hypothetical protein
VTNEELATTTLSIPVNVNPETGDEKIPIILQIEVRGGEIVGIRGQGENKVYEGTLNLKFVSTGEGGDECFKCDPACHVVPCPA